MSHIAYGAVILQYDSSSLSDPSSSYSKVATSTASFSGTGYFSACYEYSGSGAFGLLGGSYGNNLATFYFIALGGSGSGRWCGTGSVISLGSFGSGVPITLGGQSGITFNSGDFFVLTDDGDFSVPVADTSTHFISTQPTGAVATTTSTGASIYVNINDITNTANGGRLIETFSQDSAFACMNSGAVYDAFKCSGINSPQSSFSIAFNASTTDRLLSGAYDEYATTTFGGGGAWTGVYSIQNISYPWYFLGLSPVYSTIVSTTTHFIIGTSSPMDLTRAAITAEGIQQASSTGNAIGNALASTTIAMKEVCNPFHGFDVVSCITLTIWPPDSVITGNVATLMAIPPWGYAFRLYDLLTATTSTSTLPQISYSFASSSPLASWGNIHFDPLGTIQQSGVVINSFQSDQGGGNFFDIFDPYIQTIVYLALALEILRELLKFEWGGAPKERNNN